MKKRSIRTMISFGGYNWRILDVKDNMALLLTEYIIEQRSYHSAYEEITWADCALRRQKKQKSFRYGIKITITSGMVQKAERIHRIAYFC